jgi:hypothetical protein
VSAAGPQAAAEPQQLARLTRARVGYPKPPAENTAWWRTLWSFLASLAGIVTMVLAASGGATLHQLWHSALTHDAEDGTGTPC